MSRETLYINFGSRAGLLLAMVEHRDATSAELAKLRGIRSEVPPTEALEAYVRAWFKYLPDIFSVARALSAAAATDPDARTAWDSRMEQLHSSLLAPMKGLKAQKLLRSSPEAAGGLAIGSTAWCRLCGRYC